jgi:hypothetical protein
LRVKVDVGSNGKFANIESHLHVELVFQLFAIFDSNQWISKLTDVRCVEMLHSDVQLLADTGDDSIGNLIESVPQPSELQRQIHRVLCAVQ